MAGIKDYSTTQASNTDLNGISTAEGMLPSNLNNAIRALMKNTREWFNDSQWVEYGDGSGAYTAAYVSGTAFTIAGANVTSFYHAGRRIKLIATTPGTIFGTISSSSFSTNTTVNVTWDSGNLSNEAITNVFVGALSKTNTSIPTEIIGTTNIADNAVTSAKIADGTIVAADLASNAITTIKITDGNVTLAKLASDSVNGTKIADDSINSEHYVDASIDTQHIADSQITLAKLAGNSVNSSKIVDDSIVNADINSSAAINFSKMENLTTARALVSDGSGDVSVSAVTATEVGYLDGVTSAIQTQIDAKGASNANLVAIGNLAKTDGNLIVGNGSTWVAENGATARTSLGLGSVATQAANNVSISGGSVTGLGAPSSNSDAATKSYVDDLVAGLRTRVIAECATTGNVNLSNALEAGDAIDGVTLVSGDRVLVKNQSTATENGLYLAVGSGAGAASRDPEHDTIAELSGGMVVVNQGSVNDNKIFLCTTDSDGSLGSTSITYTTITPQNVGTVTSVATGTGINGGTITSSGTISIDNTVATLAGTQTLTNKTITSPTIGTKIADTNGNELALLTATSSAVNEFTVANAATNNAPRLSATGGDSNVDLDLLAKGTGHVTIRGNTNQGTLQFNCESNTHGQQIKPQPHSVGSSAVHTLPDITGDLIAGKIQGTNFTNSLLVGHATTGTLDAAEKNTGVGIAALDAVTSADFNTAVGYQAGTALTTGTKNTFIGADNGKGVSTKYQNTAVGYNALSSGSFDGHSNTVLGVNTGSAVTTGNKNVFLGWSSGNNVTSGSGNVVIGNADVSSATGSDQLSISDGEDGSVVWITGSSAGVVTLNAANVTQQALTSSSNAVAWDASAKPNAVHITTENTTFSAPSNSIEGAFICVEINYNGSHSIAWNTVFEFAASTAPTFTSADGKTDIMVFRYNGAVWQEVGRTINLSES